VGCDGEEILYICEVAADILIESQLANRMIIRSGVKAGDSQPHSKETSVLKMLHRTSDLEYFLGGNACYNKVQNNV
jgi:hypothetical protein